MFKFFQKKVAQPAIVPVAPPKALERTDLPQESSAPSKSANQRKLSFDPNLINQFEKDHRQLLELFGKISTSAAQHNWQIVVPLLSEFRILLHGHLLQEGVKLYVYLDQSLTDDADLKQLYKSYRTEMGQIGSTVFKFFDAHKDSSVFSDVGNQAQFITQLQVIGSVLVDRIQREESILYPLYALNSEP